MNLNNMYFVGILFVIFTFSFLESAKAQQWRKEIVKNNVKGGWIKPADFNNDNDMDLVVQDGDTLFWYEKKDQTWIIHIIDTLFLNSETSGLEVFDMDQDGDLDILQVPSFSASVIAWNENIMNGMQWDRHVISNSLANPGNNSDSYGDIDGDNDIDVVLPLWDGRIVLLQNNKHVEWIEKEIGIIDGNAIWSTMADMDMDNDIDIVAASYFKGEIVLFENQFPDTSWKPITIGSLSGTAIGQCRDIDNDGDIDIITHSNISNVLVWYENPSWVKHIITEGISILTYSFTRDLDQDGDYDVFFGSSKKIGWVENYNFGENWNKHIIDNGNTIPFPTGVGDFNNDGYLDITAYEIDASNQGEVFLLFNPWFVSLKNPDINKKYYLPETDTLFGRIELLNPEEKSVSVQMILESIDLSVSDTIMMSDDGAYNDSIAGDNIFGGAWPVKSAKGYFNISFNSFPEGHNSLYNILTNAAQVTSSGPVVFQDYTITSTDTIVNPGDRLVFEFSLKNESLTDSVVNITAKATSLDTCAKVIALSDPLFNNISPGEIADPNRGITIIFADDCPEVSEIPFALEIYSDGHLFWSDTFTVFVDSIVSALDEIMHKLPTVFALDQNFPNPFNPATTIGYQLPKNSYVNLSIYNLLGQKVETLVSTHQVAGYYNVNWNASGYTSGMYYYQLHTRVKENSRQTFSQVKKLLLLK